MAVYTSQRKIAESVGWHSEQGLATEGSRFSQAFIVQKRDIEDLWDMRFQA